MAARQFTSGLIMSKKIQAEVPELEPFFLSFEGAAKLSGIAKKTLQNLVSRGELPVTVRYLGSKPLLEYSSLKAWLSSLPQQPIRKRGRKRLTGTPSQAER